MANPFLTGEDKMMMDEDGSAEPRQGGLRYLSSYDFDPAEQAGMLNLGLIYCDTKAYGLAECLTGTRYSVLTAKAAGIPHVILELDNFRCGQAGGIFDKHHGALCPDWLSGLDGMLELAAPRELTSAL